MTVTALKTDLPYILQLRELYLQEMNTQIRYNACHERGWTDSYLLMTDGAEVGYGSVKGQEIQGRDSVFEYYLVPEFRKQTRDVFQALLAASGARYIECQSNDPLLSPMLYEFAHSINSDVVLFEDGVSTAHVVTGASVRRRRTEDHIFDHQLEPVGDYVVEYHGEVVATGGFMLYYNPPFADVYMEVREDCRGRGIGKFFVQELKKICYLAGRVPAARSPLDNVGSRATLVAAGLRVSGFMLLGDVKKPGETDHSGV